MLIGYPPFAGPVANGTFATAGTWPNAIQRYHLQNRATPCHTAHMENQRSSTPSTGLEPSQSLTEKVRKVQELAMRAGLGGSNKRLDDKAFMDEMWDD
jgi:hypothetical protein